MIILGNFYRIREKGDESMPEKDSIIKINKYENKIYYYEIVNGIFYFNKRFKEDSQFLKFCDKVDIESIQQYLPPNHPDLIAKLTSFPLEGCVYDDVNNLENLAKYLINRPFNQANNKTVKKDAVGIGWNNNSCWWLKTKSSEKKNYKLSDLESFLPKTEIIPEYVEATSKYDCYIIPGYVYKIIAKTDTKSLQLECNLQTGNYSPKTTLFAGTHEFSFKESSKEKYEAQNKLKQPTKDNLLTSEIYEFDTKKLIIGEIYYKHNFIFDHVSIINYSRNNTAISIMENAFFNENAAMVTYNEKPERLATDEEKKWLNVCIKQDKFIPREDLHLYDDSNFLKIKTLKEQVKEGLNLKNRWLKCIKKCDWKGINIGEYVQIMENNAIIPYVTFKKKYKVALSLDRVDSYKEFELMPEGFSPYEFKIGDYLFDSCYKQNLLTSKESFFTETDEIIINGFVMGNGQIFKNNIDSEDIYIMPITKKQTKIQTITIESITNLNLNLKTIKPKQIQTIKI